MVQLNQEKDSIKGAHKMKIRRGHFDKHKKGLWLIKIGSDKYLWFKKPNYVIKKIGLIMGVLCLFPFSLIWFVIAELFMGFFKELIIEIIKTIKDLIKEVIKIFPSYLKVVDETIVVESEFKE